MKKLFTITMLFLAALSITGCEKSYGKHSKNKAPQGMVFICTGPKAEVYHEDEYCDGLSNCSGSVEYVCLEDIEDWRRPCRRCVVQD